MRAAARRGAVATVLLTAAVALPPAGAAGPEPVFVLDGRGHGHGVGMAQDSANAMAAAGASHEQILDLFYPGTGRARRASAIRVAVWEADAPSGTVTVSAPGGARVSSEGRAQDVPPGTVLEVSADGDGYAVRATAPTRGAAVRSALLAEPTPSPSPSGEPLPALPSAEPEPSSSPSAAPSASPAPPAGRSPAPTPSPSRAPAASASPSAPASFDSASPVLLTPAGGSTLTVGATGRTYRGTLTALSRDGFRLVNTLDVEDYLLGLGEVPAGWPLAALRTQAVAARTYALRAVGSGAPLGYDVCDDTRCQVYLGVGGEKARTTQATRETRGEVVTFGGRLADTFYSANAGGVTATPAEGFGGSAVLPYLPGGTRAPGEVDPWNVTAAPGEVAARLGYPGRLDAVTVAATGPSGRVTSIRLEGVAGPRTLTGIAFQRRLGLRSTLFTVARGTGTAQPLPAADAADAQLAPTQAAAEPEPAAVPAPTVAGATTATAAAADVYLPSAPVATAVALLLLAAAGTAAGLRRS